MIGELANGMYVFAGGPFGLVGGEAFDGDAGGDEPVFFIVGGAELLEKDAAECGGRLLLLGIDGKGEGQKQEQSGFSHGSVLMTAGLREV